MEKVIFTAIFNNYDTLKEPTITTPGWDYVCFTDDIKLKSKTWIMIYMENIQPKEERKLKILNPVYSQTDLSIWVDGSIQINCNLDKFVTQYCKSDFNLMKHNIRNCVYMEAAECIKRKKDDPEIINKQMEVCREMNYPENAGMVATGILIRRKSKAVEQFCKAWWTVVATHSRRDQLSFNVVEYNNPIEHTLFPFEVLKKEFILHKHNNR